MRTLLERYNGEKKWLISKYKMFCTTNEDESNFETSGIESIILTRKEARLRIARQKYDTQ